MAQIILQQIHFHYISPYVKIFEDLSLNIDTEWKTALIGRNGCGKTTLLNLLRQKLIPTRGRVKGPPETAYFPFSPKSIQQTTFEVIKDSIAPFRLWERQMRELLADVTEENLLRHGEIAHRYEELDGYVIDALIHRETAQIGLDDELLARGFATLSGGEQTRALIVALFLRKGQYPLLDEPTNHLDLQGRMILSNYLASKQGFLVASHDRYFLDGCTDHVISMQRSDIRLVQGNYSIWKQQSDLEKEFETRQNEKLRQEIRQLKLAARQRRDWSGNKEKTKTSAYDSGFVGHRAAKQMKRALVIEKRLQQNLIEKQKLFKNYEKDRVLKLQTPEKAPEQVLRVQDLTVSFGRKVVFDQFSLTVNRGDRIAIIGGNGTGKTTLFNAICGTIEYQSGIIDFPAYLKFWRSYQQPRWQSGYLREYIQAENIDETRFRQILGVLNVEGDIFDRPLETFSQGQLKKVDLCRSFLAPAHLLLWDEPLNYIDILSREQIEQVILYFQPTLLFIEHDKYFVDKVATAVVVMGTSDPT